MADFKFSCSHCDGHLQCDEKMSGRQIQCPHCNTLIRIPHIPGKTAQYTPESGKTWGTFAGGNVAPPKGIAIQKKKATPLSGSRAAVGNPTSRMAIREIYISTA